MRYTRLSVRSSDTTKNSPGLPVEVSPERPPKRGPLSGGKCVSGGMLNWPASCNEAAGASGGSPGAATGGRAAQAAAKASTASAAGPRIIIGRILSNGCAERGLRFFTRDIAPFARRERIEDEAGEGDALQSGHLVAHRLAEPPNLTIFSGRQLDDQVCLAL